MKSVRSKSAETSKMTFNIQTVVAIILEVIAFILSVIGNSVVIYVMTREKKLKRKSNIYILSVAVADFLVGIVAIPIGIMNVSFGEEFRVQI